MRNRIFIISIFLLVVTSYADAQSGASKSAILQMDGTFWNNAEKADKLSITSGFMIGFHENSKILLDRGKVNDAGKKEIETMADLLNNVSPGMIIAAVDTYYADSKNKKVLLGDAFFASLSKIKQK